MKTWKQKTFVACIVFLGIMVCFTACNNGTEIEPITKTHTIELKDGALKFDVKYEALPSAPAPEYLTYLETRLTVMINSPVPSDGVTVNNLLAKGNHFTIRIVPGDTEGMEWNFADQEFNIYEDWISTASGIELSLSMMRDAFKSVEIN
jgi:hypothetical protein